MTSTMSRAPATVYKCRKAFFRLPRPKRAGVGHAYAHYRRLGLSRVAAFRGALAITIAATL